MTWHQDFSSMTNPGPWRKDLRRKRANYCRKSVKPGTEVTPQVAHPAADVDEDAAATAR